MVNFIEPEEYFFGTKKYFEGAEQMGVYNRNFVSIRIENYPDDKIMDLDYYYHKLQVLHSVPPNHSNVFPEKSTRKAS